MEFPRDERNQPLKGTLVALSYLSSSLVTFENAAILSRASLLAAFLGSRSATISTNVPLVSSRPCGKARSATSGEG